MADAGTGDREGWETVTARQVRAGDDIEFTREWNGGRSVTTGVVTAVDEADGVWWVTLGRRSIILPADTIRRRVRASAPDAMSEPPAPSVVRHAGRVLARVNQYETHPWVHLTAGLFLDKTTIGSWADVLALDPSADPVLIDFTPAIEAGPVTVEPGIGAVVEVGGVRYFNAPVNPSDVIAWASADLVDGNRWHGWAEIVARGPVTVLLDGARGRPQGFRISRDGIDAIFRLAPESPTPSSPWSSPTKRSTQPSTRRSAPSSRR